MIDLKDYPPEIRTEILRERKELRELAKDLDALVHHPGWSKYMKLLVKNREHWEGLAIHAPDDMLPDSRDCCRGKAVGIMLAEGIVNYTLKLYEEQREQEAEDEDRDDE